MAFSAMHSARWSGKWKFISAGASVPGVIWNTIRTPSMTSSWPVWVMSSVGASSPSDALGRGQARGRCSTWPLADRSSAARRTCRRPAGSSPCRRRRSPRPRAPGSPPARGSGRRRHRPAGRPGRRRSGRRGSGCRSPPVTGRSPRFFRYSASAAAAVSAEISGSIDDHAAVALDEGDVRQVEAADLVDALGDLEQALDRSTAVPAATGSGARSPGARRPGRRSCRGPRRPSPPRP